MNSFESKCERKCTHNKVRVIVFDVHGTVSPARLPHAKLFAEPLTTHIAEKDLPKYGNEYYADFDYNDGKVGFFEVEVYFQDGKNPPMQTVIFDECP